MNRTLIFSCNVLKLTFYKTSYQLMSPLKKLMKTVKMVQVFILVSLIHDLIHGLIIT